MTPNDVRTIINQIRYKDWDIISFCATVNENTVVRLEIVMKVRDSFHGDPTTIGSSFEFIVYLNDNQDFVLKRVLECCMKMELHEAMEHFNFMGTKPFFPDHMTHPWRIPEGVILGD